MIRKPNQTELNLFVIPVHRTKVLPGESCQRLGLKSQEEDLTHNLRIGKVHSP